MFSLFVKPSELQRWDRYSCSYSRFLNKYYHKAHSSYALLQRHRLHRGQASPPAPESCWPHKPMRWQQWSLPDVCGAAALLPRLVLCRGCSAPEPPATAWGWHSWPRALPVSSQPSVGTWRGHQGGSGFVSQLGIPMWWGNWEFWTTVGGWEKKIREVSM